MKPQFPVRSWRGELRQLKVRAEGEQLPDGVCGMVSGILLRYGVVDDYGTVFQKGCLDRTRAEKVPAGRMPLFANVEMEGGNHIRGTRTHVGTIVALDDVGDDVVMMANILDTEAGREAKEYLSAVLRSGGNTGLSIGFRDRGSETVEALDAEGDKIRALLFTEIEGIEGTIVPLSAVPGTDVLAVRSTPELAEAAFRSMATLVPRARALAIIAELDTQPGTVAADADGRTPSDTPEPTVAVSMEDRLAALRALPL